MEDLRQAILPIHEPQRDARLGNLDDPLRILARIIARDLSKRAAAASAEGSDLTSEPPFALLDKDENEG